MRILVVDDERDVAELFRQMFRREIRKGEVNLEFAFSGDDALSYLSHHPTDVVLVLSDINMPGMSGIELLKRIKEETSPPLPVCMMTAYENDEYRSKADAFGCDCYFTKPIDFPVLKRQIASFTA
jgi:CheY-like chemotaxis protein